MFINNKSTSLLEYSDGIKNINVYKKNKHKKKNKNRNKRIKEEKEKKRNELLKLFDEKDGYAEKHIGDKWYIKMLFRNKERSFWTVAVFSEESFNRYKAYWEKHKLEQCNKSHCDSST